MTARAFFFWKELKKDKRSDAFPCSDDLWRLRAREYSFEQATMTRPRMTSSSAAKHRCSIVRPPRVILKDENSRMCKGRHYRSQSATSMSAFTTERYESCGNRAVFNDRNSVNTFSKFSFKLHCEKISVDIDSQFMLDYQNAKLLTENTMNNLKNLSGFKCW